MRKMKKWRLLLYIVCCLLMIPVLSAEAEEVVYTVGGSNGAQIEFDTSTGKITGYSGTVTNMIIPDTIAGVKVLGIDNYAFSRCGSLRTVILPSTF